MLYSLIFWLKTKEVSVVDNNVIIGTKVEGEIVQVKYNGVPYEGKIIRMSESKDWLEKLEVDTKGEVVCLHQKEKKAPMRVPKNKTAAKQKDTVNARRQGDLLTIMTARHDIEKNKNMEKEEETADTDEHEKEENKMKKEEHKTKKEEHKTKKEEHKTKKEEHKTKKEEPQTKEGEHQEFKINEQELICPLCGMCPEVNASNVKFLQDLTRYVVAVQSEQLKTKIKNFRNEPENRKQAEESLTSLRSSFGADSTLVELQPGSGVTAESNFLQNLKRDYRNEPREMVRRLHKDKIGARNLAGMSASGEGVYDAIPSNIKRAIQYWVERNCAKSERLTDSEYNRTLNLMCGTIRKSMRIDIKKKKKATSSKQVPSKPRHQEVTSSEESDLPVSPKRAPLKKSPCEPGLQSPKRAQLQKSPSPKRSQLPPYRADNEPSPRRASLRKSQRTPVKYCSDVEPDSRAPRPRDSKVKRYLDLGSAAQVERQPDEYYPSKLPSFALNSSAAFTPYASNSSQYAPGTSQSASNSSQYAPGTSQSPSTSNSSQYAPGTSQFASNSSQYAPGTSQSASNSSQYAPDTLQYDPFFYNNFWKAF